MTPIDKLVGLECVKRSVDAEHKKAKLEAEEYFSDMERQGISSLHSTIFWDAGGEYKRGKTRGKEVVWYENDDWEAFDKWLDANIPQMSNFLFRNYELFCEKWFEETGEVPDGIKRRVRKDPPTQTAPKLYQYDQDAVLEVFQELGGLFEGANRLMLGDAE